MGTIYNNFPYSGNPNRDEQLFKHIDEQGGWPHNAKSLVMKHQEDRACYFVQNENVRDEWNTSILTADEYYLWKLSDRAKNKLRKAALLEASSIILRQVKDS